MNVKLILMGFQYQGPIELPSILLDIYKMYTTFQDMDPLILTDMTRDHTAQELSRCMTLENSDANIFSFIQTTRHQGITHQWNSVDFVRDQIQQHVQGSERVLFYYTGHAIHGSFVLPNGSKLKSTDVLSWMTSRVPSTSELLFLLDCCNASSMDLPYHMTMNHRASRYRSTALEKGGVFHLTSIHPIFQKPRVWCFCSAMEDEVSNMTWTGSTFTHLFIQQLKKPERNVHEILITIQQIMQRKQTCRLYTSYPDLNFLPLWLFCRSVLQVRSTRGGLVVFGTTRPSEPSPTEEDDSPSA